MEKILAIYDIKKVSAVICTWNSIASIRRCIESLKNNGVGEIIVVDADSDDGTKDVAFELADQIVIDLRKGLATARNMGINVSSGYYIINVGADNVMPLGSILRMIEVKEEMGWTGVSAVTSLEQSHKNYFNWAMNLYKPTRYYLGERHVIGTPSLFEAKILKNNLFDSAMGHSDDGDLCTRLSRIGCRFGIADVVVGEIGTDSLNSVLYRWKNYGQSDWETYSKYSATWNFRRKIYSLIYPLKNELILPFYKISGYDKIRILPFLVLITTIRYWYWLKFTTQNKL